MKKIIYTLVSFFFVFNILLFPLDASASFKKIKIAVLDFQLQGQGYETQDMGKIVAEWFTTALVKAGRFDVVERNLLNKSLQEQQLIMAGVVSENNASTLGRLLGVKVIITGSVMKIQNMVEINARIIDVESASIITAESVKSSSTTSLEDMVFEMSEKIIKDFPLEGYLVHRDGNRVMIDLGRLVGVKPGMQFVVFKEGKVIKHPTTGEVLDVERVKTGLVEITSIQTKTANGKILDENPTDPVKYGHRVKSTITYINNISSESMSITVGHGKTEKKVEKKVAPAPMPVTPVIPAGLTGIDAKFAEAAALLSKSGEMKKNGHAEWKRPFSRAMAILKPLRARHRSNPKVYFLVAKAYILENKAAKADSFLAKAIKYDKEYLAAYILRGNVNFDYARTRGRGYKNFAKRAIKSFDRAARISASPDQQAMLYFNVGLVYNEIFRKQKHARKFWEKAVSAAPGSPGGKLAIEKLGS
jgi:TolB-like protein